MAEHECTQTNNIQKLLKIVTDGNGQPSLVQQIGELSVKIDTYMGRQEDLIKEFGITSREFYEFRSHAQTVETEKDKSDMRKRWRTGILITLLVAVISTLTIVFVNRDKVLASRIDDANVRSVLRGVDSLPLYQ